MKKGIITPVILVIVAIGMVAVVTIAYFQFKPNQQLQQNQTPQQSNPQESLDISPCDVNTDGKCDVADLELLNKAFGTYRGQKDYIPLADLDADGVVNDIDKQMLLKLIGQNQADETANWKTYKATDLYEIKYPPELYSIKTETKSAQALWPGVVVIEPNDSFSNKKPLAVTYKISIASTKNEKNLTLNTPKSLFGEGPIMKYSPDLIGQKQIRQVEIGGVIAVRVDDLPIGQAGLASDILTINGNKFYEILIEPFQTSGDQNANKKIIEQILSTFNFLD